MKPGPWAVALTTLVMGAACTSAQTTERTEPEKLATLAQMVAEVRARYPEVRGVDAAQVKELVRSEGAVLVDVRPAEEREVSSIPGSITSEQFRADPTRFAHLAVVAFCTVGERSARFAREMGESGVDVLNFEGSLLAWTFANGDLASAQGPTRELHVYGPTWDLAADGYQTVW